MLLLEGLDVGLGDEEALPDADGWEPALANHPADGFGVKPPAMM